MRHRRGLGGLMLFFGFLGDGLLFLYYRWLIFLAGEQAQMGNPAKPRSRSGGGAVSRTGNLTIDFAGGRWVKFRMHPDGEEGSPRPPRALAKMLGEGAVLRDGEWQLPA